MSQSRYWVFTPVQTSWRENGAPHNAIGREIPIGRNFGNSNLGDVTGGSMPRWFVIDILKRPARDTARVPINLRRRKEKKRGRWEVKHVRGRLGLRGRKRDGAGRMNFAGNEDNGRAVNCDEIPKQVRGGLRKPASSKTQDDTRGRSGDARKYDWFVDADWPSRSYRYRGSVIEHPTVPAKRRQRDGGGGRGRNDRWERLYAIGNRRFPHPRNSDNSRTTFRHDAPKPPAQSYELAASLVLSLSVCLSFPLTCRTEKTRFSR